ncbi:membrane fusion protein, multidrug efflux system [Rhizobiales bacterium GAS113]|nr:membrane fusion protein, multidrug efflux system [Rhizobiales bacterium GAS113]
MSKHPGAFTIERPVSLEEATPVLNRADVASEMPASSRIVPEPDLRALPAEVAGPSADAVQDGTAQRPVRAKHLVRKLLLVGASLIALAGAGYLGWQYWTVGRFEVSTDDAYVQADTTTIAPKISGYLSAVLVGDNEQVKVGQVLARIDDRDFSVALDQAKADVAAAVAAIANKQASLDAQQSIIEAARATISLDQANQLFADQDNRRYSDLASSGFGSLQNAQQAASRIAAARAAVARDTASLQTAIKQLDVLKAELAQAQATLARDGALQRQAELNLSYTTIVAPVDGVVGNRTLRVGQYVQAGTQLMAVVPTDAAYIVANYKETQLTGVRPGQPVEIEVDMFPGTTFRGRVDSIAPASGQEFALLPPDNATGNFTKVVQRIPVKIIFDPGSPLALELRPGMSVYPTIDIKTQERRIASAPVVKG